MSTQNPTAIAQRFAKAESTAVQAGLTGLAKELARKDFSSGSKGFFAQGKIEVGAKRFQAQVQAVLIGSKGNSQARVRATADQMQAAVTSTIANGVPAKTFGSGSTGYRAQGKLPIGDENYQVQVQAVLIGSKPAAVTRIAA